MVAERTTNRKSDAKMEIRHAQEGLDLAIDLLTDGRPAGAALCCDNAIKALREAMALLFAEVNTTATLGGIEQYQAESR